MAKSVKIGITGLPGAGKTEALLKVIEMLEADGHIVGGMVTTPIYEHGRKIGFEVVDWHSKRTGIFAHRDYETPIKIGLLFVDTDVLNEIGVPSIEWATANASIIIIDEVGKMEVESDTFIKAVKSALETPKPLILTLHKKSRNPLLQDIRRRDDVRILEVTPINRNLLPYKIISLLKSELKGPTG